MDRQSIQTVIFSFLDYRDLISCSKVCKLFRETSKNQLFWMREFMIEFVPDTPFPQCSSADWRQLFLEGLELRSLWRVALKNLISDEEARSMSQEIFSAFTSPDLCLPPLRRELNCFPTILQDFLGNPNDIYEDSFSPLQEVLSSNRQKLVSELQNKKDMLAITTSWGKWIDKRRLNARAVADTNNKMELDLETHLHPNSALEKELVSLTNLNTTESTIRNLLDSLENTVKYFCKIHCTMIESSGNLIDNYVDRWNLYSNCIAQLNSFFLPFTDLVSEVHGQRRLTVLDIMVETWKEEVWSKLESKLIQYFLTCLEHERRAILDCSEFSFENSSLCHAFLQALGDISFTIDTVYYKNHSKLRLLGGIQRLNDEVVQESSDFYRRLDISEIVKIADKENRLLESVCLPATFLQVQRTRQQALQDKAVNQVEQFLSLTQKEDKVQTQELLKIEQILKRIEGNIKELRGEDVSIENVAEWMGCNGECLIYL